MRPQNRRRRVLGDQSGIGMVLVMGIGMLVLGMGFLAQRIFDGAITSSSGHVRSEQALHLAENGIDQTLARIAKNPDYANAADIPGGVAEKAWAMEQANAAPTERGPEGEYVAVKPPNRNVVYGVSWIPNRAAPRRTRVVKAEYLLSAFNPVQALLVGGSLKLNGNPEVSGNAGNIHANGPIDWAGSPSASGSVTTSGGFVGNKLPQPPQSFDAAGPLVLIPEVNPLAEWYRSAAANLGSWYDLCDDGKARLPDGAKPCAGTVVGTTNFRNFKFSSPKWTVSGNAGSDGIYFAYKTNIVVSGNPGSDPPGTPWKTTLFAAPAEGTVCPNLQTGDIEISGNPAIVPFLDGLTLMAGRDLKLNGNPSAASVSYSGLMMAKEQVDISGNPAIEGAVIAEDACNTPGSPFSSSGVGGNAKINYDGDLEVKIGNIPRTTLWLEL